MQAGILTALIFLVLSTLAVLLLLIGADPAVNDSAFVGGIVQ